jgi:tRNA dimethylallyltransferase
MSEKKEIIFIVGPTAIGKSNVGILLAERIGAEIISCDSMQIYNEVNIASAKPTEEQLARIKHYLIGDISVEDDFDVVKFRKRAVKAMEGVFEKGRIPVLVGGSGMYMKALLDGVFQDVPKDEVLRAKLEKQAEAEGNVTLYEELKKIDPAAAFKIHVNDQRRTIRALEVCLKTKSKFSQLQKNTDGLWGKYKVHLFALNQDRELLYNHINERVDQMFDSGVEDEIRSLEKLNLSSTAARLIGIKELIGYFHGEYDLDRAKYLMKRNTRHFAKRQLTWFRKEERLIWIDVDREETANQIVDKICKDIKEDE